MEDESREALVARVGRTFGERTPGEIAADYRALVGPTATDDARVREAYACLREGRVLGPLLRAALEEAIRVFRPSVPSRKGRLPLPAEHRTALPHWDSFATGVRPHLYAVGRIDRGPAAPSCVPAHVGTGFLVAPEVLVTNRHVLEVLSVGGRDLERGMAVVRFGQEIDTVDTEAAIDVIGVLAIHPTADIACFEVAARTSEAGRSPLVLGAEPKATDAVVTLGYPSSDRERNPLFADPVFGGRYGVKRASPGEIIGAGRGSVHHDASTLGGSSGSPLVDALSGRVVGVHARGGFAVRNTAVSVSVLEELVRPFLTRGSS